MKPGSYWTTRGPLGIRAGNLLGQWLRKVAEVLEEGARRVERCPDCGENRWSGRPCK
jgi:hypothetical protein